ncbi:hypothetical protein BGX26_001629 [Mortierella sp. AD094]|nr:hypothetical protein BGX26_001629 [Mortierella sp. AD094]
MRTLTWSSLVLGLSVALQFALELGHISEHEFVYDQPYSNGVSSGCHGMTKQTAHDDNIYNNNNDSPKSSESQRRLPITQIKVLQGQDAQMGPDWEKVEGNLNHGNRGPVLTLFVKREPGQAPIESLVVKYGFDSHAAIGYDRLPMDLNVGTGGQWVYLYFKRAGPREPITHIATKACALPPCVLDDSWTRINRPIMTGTFKRYLYLFYKSVPGERPITHINLSLKGQSDEDDGEDVDKERIDTGIRYKNNNVFVAYKRGQHGDTEHVIDNIAILLGSNPVPPNWDAATFERGAEEVPDWNAQVIYRASNMALPKAPTLRFNEDGSFKIVQFADIHMATGPHSCHNVPSTMECTGDINTIEMMERMLDSERPDLVVYTGDNVDGLTSNDAFSTILKYSKPVIDRGIPWTIIFGNHDEEGDLSREEMIMSAKDLPYSLSQRGPLGVSGTGNYVLQIYDHKRRRRHGYFGLDDAQFGLNEFEGEDQDSESSFKKEKSRFTLYFLDSGAYSFSLEYPGWDWIKDDQVEWFRQTSKAITSQYTQGTVPNALAFFHIPIPEYALVEDGDDDDDEGDEGGDDDDSDYHYRGYRNKGEKSGHIVGDKNEGVSAPSYNSGMFEAFLESKDVRATTAGHDHLNEYCLDHRGINLCYGGGLGYGSYGSASIPRRSRVFEIRNHGDRVDTWKRLDNEEMTLVGEQTLFVGKKIPSSKRPGNSNRSKASPSRLTEDIFERLRQGSQYVMGGL